jgi:4-phospho-D-threonate 3-dehydrogenase / 4-phospho-D-erythronate 3-dehydrogenase
MNNLPKIAITMGDPAGVGPEVSLKAAQSAEILALCQPILYGEPATLTDCAERLGIQSAGFRIRPAGKAECAITPGTIQAEAGRLAADAIFAAIKDALEGEVDAVVTAPINKKALSAAGFNYAGHTELFADKTQTRAYGMMLVSGALRVVHVSTHVSLSEAIRRVKTERVLECIRLAELGCRQLGINKPRIAAAGLNPHAGEDGLFGYEDQNEIRPAVQLAEEAGISASGPYPPDTVFYRASRGEFDAVVAMYHDQGHIPVKLHGFDTGVNITLGLPIIRVSVDHGTAFDIAGTGTARPNSMIQAIRTAIDIAHARGEETAK